MFGSSSVDRATCIEDLRTIARRRVPRAFFQYADHGSYSQSTLRANRAGLDAIGLRQRVGIDVSKRDLSTTIAGQPPRCSKQCTWAVTQYSSSWDANASAYR